MAVLEIEKAIYWLLTSGPDSAALVALRGTRVRPGQGQQEDARPYQVYARTDGGDEGHFTGANKTEPSVVVVESYAGTLGVLNQVMSATRTALHCKGSSGGSPLTVTVGGDSVAIYEMAITESETDREAPKDGQGGGVHVGRQAVEIWHQV